MAGFHAFRHFNVSLLDALRIPLKTIQERMGHALTGSFTLDAYGGKPEWDRNLEAARSAGAEIEKAVHRPIAKRQQHCKTSSGKGSVEADCSGALTPIRRSTNRHGLEASNS
jgi:hypothetical protein